MVHGNLGRHRRQTDDQEQNPVLEVDGSVVDSLGEGPLKTARHDPRDQILQSAERTQKSAEHPAPEKGRDHGEHDHDQQRHIPEVDARTHHDSTGDMRDGEETTVEESQINEHHGKRDTPYPLFLREEGVQDQSQKEKEANHGSPPGLEQQPRQGGFILEILEGRKVQAGDILGRRRPG